MAATPEVPSSTLPDQSSPEAGVGARRMAPEERIASLMDGLHTILDEAVQSPSHWQVLLDASANLWRYSGGNVALLMMQMAQRGTDEPTLVAGYKEWERHGRTVLRGEHALWVIAPRTARVQQMLLPDGTRQRIPLGDKLPKGAIDEGKKILITGWRGQAVFDVSQTQGAPLLVPRPSDAPTFDALNLWESLARVARTHGFSIQVTDAQFGLTSGFTDFAHRQVQVGGWLNAEERVAVLAHELGHVLLHGPDDNVGKLYGSSVDHRGLAEVEAESVAYTVLKAHGIDRGPQSASYLSGWADAVIEAEHSAAGNDSSRRQPPSRTDIAKSVLGRVTAAAKQILEATDPPGTGGKVPVAEVSPKVHGQETYAGLEQPGEPSRGLEISGP